MTSLYDPCPRKCDWWYAVDTGSDPVNVEAMVDQRLAEANGEAGTDLDFTPRPCETCRSKGVVESPFAEQLLTFLGEKGIIPVVPLIQAATSVAVPVIQAITALADTPADQPAAAGQDK